MRKTIFLPMATYFPTRHQTFIQTLNEQFNLVVHGESRWTFPDKTVISTSQIWEQMGDIETLPEYAEQWAANEDFILDAVTRIVGTAASRDILKQQLLKNKSIFAETLKTALLLDEIHKQHKIDAVVTGSDYTRYSRPLLYMAQQLNIPTVHIEHGLFTCKPYPYRGTEKNAYSPFAANYVILDNPLEVDIFKSYNPQTSVKQLLSLGAPLDNLISNDTVSQEEAKRVLNIPQKRHCVSIGLSWSEPHGPYAPVWNHQVEVMFVQFVLNAIRNRADSDSFHVIIKLHPAISDFGAHESVTRFYTEMARRLGMLPNTLIISDKLKETINAADLLVARTQSSILWDAITHGTPTAMTMMSALQNRNHDFPPPPSAVAEAQLMHYIRRESDFQALLSEVISPGYRETFAARRDAFKRNWKITDDTALTKSKRIAEWIDKTL